MIYLDHNATSPLDPAALAAMIECHEAGWGNPASQHTAGRLSRRRLEDARDEIAAMLGLASARSRGDRLVFTSGGTEANNLAIFGLAGHSPGIIVSSAIEHPSVLGPLRRLADGGWQIELANITRGGQIDADHARSLIEKPDVRLAVFMLANNETGVLQPIDQVARACQAAGVPLHVDAVQAAGKIAIDFRELGATTMSVAAHKFHGPPGIGALAVAGDARLEPLLCGGVQQFGLRPGTECTALAAGMQAALALWHADRQQTAPRLAALRDQLECGLAAAGLNIEVHGGASPRLPQTSNIAFLGLDRQALTMALDMAGVACSTGSACASGSSEPSAAIAAMGCSAEALAGSVRFSLGRGTTAELVAEAARRIIKVCNNLQPAFLGSKISPANTKAPSNTI